LRGLLARDDDLTPSAGKPVCDYEDLQAREELIDALVRDARALAIRPLRANLTVTDSRGSPW
jgi:hypothetical protein